jgi:outer membrane protein assembly factor BamE (lipoprotein component of BamABCDE complex)
MPRIAKLVLGAIVALLLLPVFVTIYYYGVRHYTLSDSLCSCLFAFQMDTKWAAGYSERNFSKVRVGMSQDEVRRIMGEPIWNPNPDYWGYTESPSSTHYHQRGFVFSPSGKVTQIVKGFYFD